MENKNVKLDKMEKAELMQFASNLQSRLNKSEELNVDLRAQLVLCAEERDLIRKKFEEQSISEEKFNLIHEQMVHKDNKIMELNNIILERERQIIDLQEMCTEQGKVAKSKSLAFGIVNKRLHELDSRNMKDASTETDFGDEKFAAVLKRQSRSPRRNSPGRAIPQFKFGTNGSGSPPPIDPEDGSSFTTETLNPADLNEISRIKKQRKKVTFDDETSSASNLRELEPSPNVLLKINSSPSDLEELLLENENLRQIISEMEKRNSNIHKAVQPESLQILKVKAAAQTRIKELEGIVAQNKQNYDSMTAEMHAIIEQLKESREWVLNENYKLQEQLDTSKEKCNDLHNELDTSLKTIDIFRKKLDGNSRKFEEIQTELYQNRIQTQKINDEKAILAIEIERLKEAIFAQDEFISLLEGDLIVYEAHVGILRDSLGAGSTSKKEDRQHLKSKAFSAKINALESEKEEIAKKNNEEKLRVKALAVKIKYLEEERDSLKMKIRQIEKANFNEFEQQQLADSNEATMAMKTDELLKLEEEIVQKNGEIDHLMDENQKMTEQINSLKEDISDTNLAIGNFFSSISLLIGAENISFDDDLMGKLKFVEEKLNEAYQNFAKTNEKLNLLEENVASKDEEVESLKNEIRSVQEASELQTLELNKFKEEYQEILVKIQQKDNMIGTFEQRNVELAKELAADKIALTSLETKNNSLENELLGLRKQLELLEEEITQKKAENDELEEKLHSSNIECESLSKTLSEKKTQLDKLISILTEIVNRFKMGSNLDTFSTTSTTLNDSIDEFINKIEIGSNVTVAQMPSTVQKEQIVPQKSTASFSKGIQASLDGNGELKMELQQREMQIKSMKIELENEKKNSIGIRAEFEDTVNSLMSEKEELMKQQKTTASFSKGIQASLDGNGELKMELQQREMQIKSMKIELENEKKNSIGIRAECDETVNSMIAKNEELKKCKENSEIQLEKAQKSNSKINAELIELKESIELMEKQRQIELENSKKNLPVEKQTMTEHLETANQFVQTFGDDEINQNCEDEEEKQNGEGEEQKLQAGLSRKESEQLLVDCVKERAEFERHLGDNVQQLLELKGELENSVDVLKGEIWSLNSELKKHFDERDFLKSQLKEMEQIIHVYKSQNDNLQAGMSGKDEKMMEIREQNGQLENRIKELNSLLEEKSKRINVLEGLALKLKEQFKICTQKWKLDLEEFRQLNLAYKKQFFQLIEQMVECTNSGLKQFEASRLAIKTTDNEKLLRENSELIQTNLELQTKLDGFMNDNLETTHFTHEEEPKMETTAEMETIGMKETKEADINDVEMDLQKWNSEGNNDGELETNEPLDDDEGKKEEIGNEEEKTMPEAMDDWNCWNQIGQEEEEHSTEVDQPKEEENSSDDQQKERKYSLEVEQKKEEEYSSIDQPKEEKHSSVEKQKEEEHSEVEEPNEEENSPEIDHQKNEEQFDKKSTVETANNGNPDDWNWGDEQEEEEDDAKEENGNDGGNTPKNDEWAWNDEDEEEEGNDEMNKEKASGTVDHNKQQPEKNVKQLFEDW